MATTAQQLIDAAGRKLGVLGVGETMGATEAGTALDALNYLIGEWSADKSMSLVSLTTFATLATSQTLTTGYDEALTYALAVRLAPEYQQAASQELTQLALQTRQIVSRPAAATVDTSGTVIITKSLRLLGVLGISDAPTTKEVEYALSTLNSMIGTWNANRDMTIVTLTTYATAATTQTLPAGYDQALVYNLAVALAPNYGKVGDALGTIPQIASQTYQWIRRPAIAAAGTTAQKIVDRALRLIGQIGPHEASTATEGGYALDALNSMLASWRNERLMAYEIQNQAKAIGTGASSVTVGSAGAWTIERPVKIESIQWVEQSISFPVRLIEQKDFQRLAATPSTGTPEYAWYDSAFPTATLNFYPTTVNAGSMVIGVRVPLTAIATLATAVSLPPGYERAMIYNLAVEIAPEYGKEASASTQDIAVESKAVVKRTNIIVPVLDMPYGIPMRGQTSNIIRGY